MSTSPVLPSSSTADKILSFLDLILEQAGTLIPGANLADFFLKIIQRGVSAYESQTGKPIDPTLIKNIDKVV